MKNMPSVEQSAGFQSHAPVSLHTPVRTAPFSFPSCTPCAFGPFPLQGVSITPLKPQPHAQEPETCICWREENQIVGNAAHEKRQGEKRGKKQSHFLLLAESVHFPWLSHPPSTAKTQRKICLIFFFPGRYLLSVVFFFLKKAPSLLLSTTQLLQEPKAG